MVLLSCIMGNGGFWDFDRYKGLTVKISLPLLLQFYDSSFIFHWSVSLKQHFASNFLDHGARAAPTDRFLFKGSHFSSFTGC